MTTYTDWAMLDSYKLPFHKINGDLFCISPDLHYLCPQICKVYEENNDDDGLCGAAHVGA